MAGMMKSSSVCVVVSCTYCVRPCRVCVMMCSSCQPRLVASCCSVCSCCCVSVCPIVAVMSYLVCVGCGGVGCSVIFSLLLLFDVLFCECADVSL